MNTITALSGALVRNAAAGAMIAATFAVFVTGCAAASAGPEGFVSQDDKEVTKGAAGSDGGSDGGSVTFVQPPAVDASGSCASSGDCPKGATCDLSQTGGDIRNGVCVTASYAIGGTITGLAAGASVVVQNNGSDDLTIAADGTFTFATPIASAQTYDVTVLTQPSSPAETCKVTMGSGTVESAAITSVAIACSQPTYTCICPFNTPMPNLMGSCSGQPVTSYPGSGIVPGNVCSIGQGSQVQCTEDLQQTEGSCYATDHVPGTQCSPASGVLQDTGTGVGMSGRWSCTRNP